MELTGLITPSTAIGPADEAQCEQSRFVVHPAHLIRRTKGDKVEYENNGSVLRINVERELGV